MKPGYTHIAVVLDRSGSMQDVKTDTIGGFNSFLEDQKNLPGDATLTLIGFDDHYETWRDFVALKDVQALDDATFVPRGMTALLDAIGRTITETGAHLEQLPENDRPEKVVMAIMTDGLENHSLKFNAHQIGELITHQRDVYKWQFLFNRGESRRDSLGGEDEHPGRRCSHLSCFWRRRASGNELL
jgi:hypothetical protein